MSTLIFSYKKQIRFGLLIVLAVLVVLGVIFGRGKLSGIDFSKPTTPITTARLEININDSKRAFEGGVSDGMTIFEALQASSLAGNLSFAYDFSDSGNIMLKSFDGYEADKTEKPIKLYLNSTPIKTEKINSTPIKAGDTIFIKLER